MKIHIDKRYADIDFVDALVDRVKRQLYGIVDTYSKDLERWDEFISLNIDMFSYSLKRIDAYDILTEGIKNIQYIETPSEFIIQIDEKKYIYGVYVSISDMCKLINYGNLTMRGLYIFSIIFNDTERSLKKLEDLYYSGELI